MQEANRVAAGVEIRNGHSRPAKQVIGIRRREIDHRLQIGADQDQVAGQIPGDICPVQRWRRVKRSFVHRYRQGGDIGGSGSIGAAERESNDITGVVPQSTNR